MVILLKNCVVFLLLFALMTTIAGVHPSTVSAAGVNIMYWESASVVINCTDSSAIVTSIVDSTNASLVHFPSGVNMSSPNLANVTMLMLTFANNASTLRYWVSKGSNATQIADAETPILVSAFNTTFTLNLTTPSAPLEANVTYNGLGKQNLTQYTEHLMTQCLASDLGGFSLTFLPLSHQPNATIVVLAMKNPISETSDWTYSMGASYTTDVVTGSGDHLIDVLAWLKLNSVAPSPYASFGGYYESSSSLVVFSNTTESFVSCQPAQTSNILQRGWYILPSVPPPARLMASFSFGNDASSVSQLTFTFSGIVIPLEAHIDVPFYYQDKDYYCGPACLQMVFNYYGENVSQSEIADVARTIGEPVYSTFTDELRRAGHFSNQSTSMGDEMPENITGYALRTLGYAAFESQGMDLTMFKETLDESGPLILLMYYSSMHFSTHYRVATGYNETHVFLHDPWNNVTWGGKYGGPNIPFNNTEFMDLWSYYDNWALLVSPWKVDLSFPRYIKPETPFQINATITYPEPPPNALSDCPASSCNASIALPANLSLAEGEIQKKTIGTGSLLAGTNATVNWMLIANSPVIGTVNITAEGMISGSVWAHVNYTAYDYDDRIGATANLTIQLDEDNTAPEIGTPSRVSDTDVQPYQDVRVSANVTDTESGVQNATLLYTTDNGTTWENTTMDFNQSTSLYEATIPGQQAGTWVKFRIAACDHLGNNATLDGAEPYCAYQVMPEFPSFLILPLFMALTLLAVIVYRRKHSMQLHESSKITLSTKPITQSFPSHSPGCECNVKQA